MVSGHQFTDPVLHTQGRDVRIVNKVSRHATLYHHRHHDLRMPLRLVQQNEHRGTQNPLQISQGNLQGHGWMVDSRMCYHTQKLVNTRPRDCPWYRTFGLFLKNLSRNRVVGAGANLGVHKDIRVNGSQRLPTVHDIEEIVPVQDVNTRLKFGIPPFKFQSIGFAPILNCHRLPEQIVDQRCQ